MLSEKEKGDGWMEGIFSREIRDWGELNTEFDMEEVDFNVSNREISEPAYLEVRDILLKLKLQNNTRNRWNKGRDFTESGSSCVEEDTQCR